MIPNIYDENVDGNFRLATPAETAALAILEAARQQIINSPVYEDRQYLTNDCDAMRMAEGCVRAAMGLMVEPEFDVFLADANQAIAHLTDDRNLMLDTLKAMLDHLSGSMAATVAAVVKRMDPRAKFCVDCGLKIVRPTNTQCVDCYAADILRTKPSPPPAGGICPVCQKPKEKLYAILCNACNAEADAEQEVSA